MADELKGLIDKIQEEGVKAAEEKAALVEERARQIAASTISSAMKEAKRIKEEAEDIARRREESGKLLLEQAARDLIIALRKEIEAMLDRIVTSHVHRALDPEELTRIIVTLVKECSKEAEGNIVITLKKEDLEKLEKGFLNELKEEMKKGIILKAADDIRGGFTISYDLNRSYYDFTDKSLAGYIASSLKPGLARILDEAL